VWCLEEHGGRTTKIPYQVSTGARASSTNPADWTSFKAARNRLKAGEYDGLGFRLGGGWAGIDLDKCRDPKTGTISKAAWQIICRFDSYTEISPSLTGVKIFVRAKCDPLERNRINHPCDGIGGIEIYNRDRYFTVTGLHLDGTPTSVSDREDVFRRLHAVPAVSCVFEHDGQQSMKPPASRQPVDITKKLATHRPTKRAAAISEPSVKRRMRQPMTGIRVANDRPRKKAIIVFLGKDTPP
jgi:hypothetical protein